MKRITSIVIFLIFAIMTTGAAAKWSEPVQLAGSESAFWPSLSDDGQTVAWLKLSGLSSNDATNLEVQVSQMHKGKWQKPITVATNGVKRGMPIAETRPTLSGDGKTMVYMGLDPVKNEHRIYEVHKNADGKWQKPTIIEAIPPGWYGDKLSLDRSGNTLAYLMGDGGFFGGTSVLNIIEKTENGWGTPVKLVTPGYAGGAADPMLSSDGTKIVFLQANANYDVVFVEKTNGQWQIPYALVVNSDDKKMTAISGDGKTIFYYTSHVKNGVLTGYDILALKRNGTIWGKPAKLNANLVPATLMYDQALSASENGNTVTYANFIQKGDSISSSSIVTLTYSKGAWSKPFTVVKPSWGLHVFPLLSADGKLICFLNYTLQTVKENVK